jgi:hypothetical protein
MTYHNEFAKRTAIILGVILLAVLGFVIVTSIIEIEREQIEVETEPINRLIESYKMDFSALDRYVRTNYPDKCDGLSFIEANANVTISGAMIQSGTIILNYYRFIDETKEGGNIEAIEFYIDPVSGTLLNAVHYQGSGRSYSTSDEPIGGNALTIPLENYIQNAADLAGVEPDETVRMLAVYRSSQLNVQLFTEETQGAVYTEIVTGWDEEAGFASRAIEPLN